MSAAESAPETEAAPAPAPAPEAKAAPVEEPADEADEADDVPGEQPATPAVEAKLDPDTAKRLEAIQRNERRAKDEIAKARAELDAERKRLEPDLAELAKIRDLRKRARLGDASAMLELGGFADDDAEAVARSVYSLSKAAQANPASREAAARVLREREQMSALEETRKELAALRDDVKRERESAAREREVAGYLDTASKAATDDTPIMRAMLERNPELARQRIKTARDYFHEHTGEIPDPADVLRELEIVERNELIARGVDPDSIRIQKKTNPAAPETKKAAKTLTTDLGTPTKPRTAPRNPKEERDELLRELERGQLDG
jgi:hypothetical protein